MTIAGKSMMNEDVGILFNKWLEFSSNRFDSLVFGGGLMDSRVCKKTSHMDLFGVSVGLGQSVFGVGPFCRISEDLTFAISANL